MPTIYTCGHSNKPMPEYLAMLRVWGIGTLVDVRSRPSSRFNPQFNRAAMSVELEKAGVIYEFRGKNLGGLEGNVYYGETIAELVKRVRGGEQIALSCSEGTPDKCHRKSMLTPSLMTAGLSVCHLLFTGEAVMAEKPSSSQQEAMF